MNQANEEFEELVKAAGQDLESKLVELKLTKSLWRLVSFITDSAPTNPLGYANLDDFINRLLRSRLNEDIGYIKMQGHGCILQIISTCSDEEFKEFIKNLREESSKYNGQ